MESTNAELIPYEDIDLEIKTLYLDPRGLTYKQIADQLGVSSTRVQKRINRMEARGEIQRNRGKGFRPSRSAPSFGHIL